MFKILVTFVSRQRLKISLYFTDNEESLKFLSRKLTYAK